MTEVLSIEHTKIHDVAMTEVLGIEHTRILDVAMTEVLSIEHTKILDVAMTEVLGIEHTRILDVAMTVVLSIEHTRILDVAMTAHYRDCNSKSDSAPNTGKYMRSLLVRCELRANIRIFSLTHINSGRKVNNVGARAQELCESRGGRPWLPSLISLRFLWT